jgi:hypothetical protein
MEAVEWLSTEAVEKYSMKVVEGCGIVEYGTAER